MWTALRSWGPAKLAPPARLAGPDRGSRGPGPLIWINPIPEPKSVKNRMHLDVIGDKAELLSLGATMVRDPPHCLAADPRPAHWAAVHAALDDPRYVAILLGSLREAGAHQQTAALLARNPAAHVALDNPASMPNSVAALLNRLWLVGAPEQAAALLARAAAHAPLDDPHGVATLLDSLRPARARASRPPRWQVGCRRPACSGSSSSRTAPRISSASDVRPTAHRLRHGAGKTWTYGLSSPAGTSGTDAAISGCPRGGSTS